MLCVHCSALGEVLLVRLYTLHAFCIYIYIYVILYGSYLISCGTGDGPGAAAAAVGPPAVFGVVLQGGQAVISGHGSLL